VTSQWGYDDALVLAAIATDERVALKELVALIDACGHTVLSEDQFNAAVGHLVGSGLVVAEREPRFALTDAGRAIADRRTGGIIGQVFSLEELLVAVPLINAAWVSPAGVYDRAVKKAAPWPLRWLSALVR
jgi:hypothetical protein